MHVQRIRKGALVEIDLGDGAIAFGRILSKSEVGFHAFRKSRGDKTEVDLVLDSPILFIVPVMNHAITRGRWRIVDSRPLDPSLEQVRFYAMRDALTGAWSIYNAGDGSIRPAAPGEETGLEHAAVWDPEHVEERLRDHFAGRPNFSADRLAG